MSFSLERYIRLAAGRAADRVEAGWCRGDYRKVIRGRVHYCLVGAIQASTRSDLIESGVIDRVVAILKASPWGHFNLTSWNDEKWRRKEQVVRLLRRVAAGEGT